MLIMTTTCGSVFAIHLTEKQPWHRTSGLCLHRSELVQHCTEQAPSTHSGRLNISQLVLLVSPWDCLIVQNDISSCNISPICVPTAFLFLPFCQFITVLQEQPCNKTLNILICSPKGNLHLKQSCYQLLKSSVTLFLLLLFYSYDNMMFHVNFHVLACLQVNSVNRMLSSQHQAVFKVNCITYAISLQKEYGVWQSYLLSNIIRFLYKVQVTDYYCILFFYDFLRGIIRSYRWGKPVY